MPKFFQQLFQVPFLTRYRVGCAYAVAVVADVIQFLLGPLGWAFADELLDISAMILIWRLIGFHPLLLPTFVLEFLPVADMLPNLDWMRVFRCRHSQTPTSREPRVIASWPRHRCLEGTATAMPSIQKLYAAELEEAPAEVPADSF